MMSLGYEDRRGAKLVLLAKAPSSRSTVQDRRPGSYRMSNQFGHGEQIVCRGSHRALSGNPITASALPRQSEITATSPVSRNRLPVRRCALHPSIVRAVPQRPRWSSSI